MKGNISRESHRPADCYSGVFQVQGGMVTDADLGEQANIARRRADALGKDTAGCGVPADGGAVQLTGGLRLAEGVVYADGVRGETRATGALAGPLSLYDLQRDLPLAPTLPNTGALMVYADVWERTVALLEDPLLSDPGLQGAETALRKRTMAQIKFAPANQAAVLGAADGPIPRLGGGVLSVTPVDAETIADPCDPCADVVAAEQTVANGLFRIEVVHVFGTAQAPDQIRIAWSDENASAIARADVNSEDFSRTGAVYEYFSYASETHLGVHHANAEVARSSFGESLAAGPADPAAPEGGDWPFVRRWGGVGLVDFNASSAQRLGGGGGLAVSGRRLTLTVDAFTAEIDFSGMPTVAGDYWLVETRRFAETPIRAVSDRPLGIRHHYCPLFRVTDGAIEALSDQEQRRLSFPALANMPATHVAFDNSCSKLYADAENVQEALDRLCDIEAADIAFDPSDCPRLFDNTDNVQDALINLCKIDFGTDRLLRLLHDWGVICGVIPARVGNERALVSYTAGAILDRAGKLAEIKAGSLDLDKLVGTEFFHFADLGVFDKQLRAGQVCLALAIAESGQIDAHLAPKDIAFGPAQPTLLSVFEECRKKQPPFDPKDDFTSRPKAERDALDKVVYGAANPKLAGSQRLDSKQQEVARQYNQDLVSRYKAHINDEAAVVLLDDRIKQIEREFPVTGSSGSVRETRLLQREAAVYGLVRETDAERLRRCLCDALLPRCPILGKAPFLVPITCLEGATEGGRIFLSDLCIPCCRKQAMSWRMVQYYFAEIRERLCDSITGFCCPPEQDDNGGIRPQPGGGFNFGAIETQVTPEFFADQAAKSLRILTGRNPPSDYAIKPDIDDLGIDQAKTALAGNGVEVAQTINVDDATAIDKIRDASAGVKARDLVLDNGALAPGDKVALIVKEGVAIDYIKLETGAGKYLYESAAVKGGTLVTDLEGAERSVAELETRFKATEDAAKEADAELGALLDARRKAIADQTATAESDLAALQASRDELSTELSNVRKEVDAARVELDQLNADQKVVLAEVEKERDLVVMSIRRETPVTAVVKDERVTAVLAKRGVTNLGALAALPDAELKELAAEAGVSLTIARRLKRDADTRLKAPIG